MLDMENMAKVDSDDLGRPKSENPKGIHLGLRIDQATADAIDVEIERLKKLTGITLSRSMVVRQLLESALGISQKRKK
jgi:hypothetical protein